MAQVAPQPVELPHDQRIAMTQRLDARIQPRPVVALEVDDMAAILRLQHPFAEVP